MIKTKIRKLILNNLFLREVFFILGKRKVSLKSIDKKIRKLDYDRIISKEHIANLVVSLTSYGERMDELKYTLFSLLNQSILPEIVQVNISENDNEKLPEELRLFQKLGVVFYVCENLRSYTKLIPALEKYPEKVIITCDDDIYYEKKWLERLWNCHVKNPKDVICHRIYNVTDDGNKILSYKKWVHNEKKEGVSNRNFLMGVGGVLYPPYCLYKDVTNKELFKKLSPAADDIWFYFMTVMNETKIRHCDKAYLNLRFVNPYREYGIVEGSTLGQENVGLGKNDIQFKAIMEHYKINEKEYIEYLNSNINFTKIVKFEG